jgi:hypothetical protein
MDNLTFFLYDQIVKRTCKDIDLRGGKSNTSVHEWSSLGQKVYQWYTERKETVEKFLEAEEKKEQEKQQKQVEVKQVEEDKKSKICTYQKIKSSILCWFLNQNGYDTVPMRLGLAKIRLNDWTLTEDLSPELRNELKLIEKEVESIKNGGQYLQQFGIKFIAPVIDAKWDEWMQMLHDACTYESVVHNVYLLDHFSVQLVMYELQRGFDSKISKIPHFCIWNYVCLWYEYKVVLKVPSPGAGLDQEIIVREHVQDDYKAGAIYVQHRAYELMRKKLYEVIDTKKVLLIVKVGVYSKICPKLNVNQYKF